MKNPLLSYSYTRFDSDENRKAGCSIAEFHHPGRMNGMTLSFWYFLNFRALPIISFR